VVHPHRNASVVRPSATQTAPESLPREVITHIRKQHAGPDSAASCGSSAKLFRNWSGFWQPST
jgi:hypothetical protein